MAVTDWQAIFGFFCIQKVNPRHLQRRQVHLHSAARISLLGSVVWGHHMYTVGLETDTRAYFSGVTILISLPTGTKIFNWLSTYLGNPPLLQLKTNSPFFGLLFFFFFTIGGSTGIILGNAGVDLGLHDTYYVVTMKLPMSTSQESFIWCLHYFSFSFLISLSCPRFRSDGRENRIRHLLLSKPGISCFFFISSSSRLDL